MDEVTVSKNFIEELPSAPPSYVTIFLMTSAMETEDAAAVADRLDVLKSDVLKAWKYWEERGLMGKSRVVQKVVPREVMERRPEYSPEELRAYMQHEDIKRLLVSAQTTLGRMLTQQDISTLFSFYDWLGMPVAVIEMLISYCASNGKTGMRYIEKVAIGWTEDGIDTVEAAIAYIEIRKTAFQAVIQSFGIKGRAPIEKEIEFIMKWIKEYKFSVEIIKNACERTILQTAKPSFQYADSILKRWKEANVKTIADIDILDKAFEAKKASGATAAPKTQAPPPKRNKFMNHTQRKWDFDKIEQMEQEKNTQG